MKESLTELIKENPWTEVANDYKAQKVLSKENREWYCAEDESAIKKNSDKLTLELDPSPWQGRWNVEDESQLPKLLILAFNPGATSLDGTEESIQNAEAHRLTKEQAQEYTLLTKKNLTGKATFTEILFSPAALQRNHYMSRGKNSEPRSYWLERLYSLYEEAAQAANIEVIKQQELRKLTYEHISKNQEDERIAFVKQFFDSIMTLELCAYHSKKANDVGNVGTYDNPLYTSSKFTAELVGFLHRNGAKVIIARSKSFWEGFLTGVMDEKKNAECILLNNPQAIYITKKNMTKYNPDGTWDELVSLMAKSK